MKSSDKIKIETWETVIFPKLVKNLFSLRLQKDIQLTPKIDLEQKLIKSCFIHGINKTGKTVLAAQMLLYECKNMYFKYPILDSIRPMFVSCSDLLYQIRKDMKEDSGFNLIEKCKGARILVLDDIGTDKCSEWVLDILFHLLNHRYNNILTTIFTSNLTFDQIADKYDDRIASRVERISEEIIELNGKY